MPGKPDPGQHALYALGVLIRLMLEAGQSRDRAELAFRVLNQTLELTRYTRACLFEMGGGKPGFLGVSGQSGLPGQSELASLWETLLGGLVDPDTPRVLAQGDFSGELAPVWRDLSGRTAGLSVAWLPIFSRERLAAGLWLERWGGALWTEKELDVLQTLAKGHSIAWEKCSRRFDTPKWAASLAAKPRALVLVLAAAALLALPVSLRVVAPCEVGAKDPFVVTAPIPGVVAEVAVKPGRRVEKGDLLFAYDKRVATEDLKVARQQVQIMQSSLNRSRMQAFRDPGAKGEMSLLELKLEQEKVRLELAESNAAKLEVAAETDGVVVIDDPSEWRGRPVAVGEKVLMIVAPDRTKVRIWLPVDDNVPFDRSKPVTVYLNAFPEADDQARLEYVAANVSVSPQGFPCVVAEGEWTATGSPLRIGLQGTAVIRGPDVPLAYWLLRKPLAWARKSVGL